MATGAGGTGVGVVEGRGGPSACLVAILTGIACRQVIGGLPAGRRAIVAAHAIAGDPAMVKARCTPTRCGMAGAAFLGRGDMG